MALQSHGLMRAIIQYEEAAGHHFIDLDGNGMLDKTEMLTLLNEVAPPAEEDDVDFVFEELRKAGKVRDGDDKISFEAMGPACALWIDCAKDLDRDGADLVVETPPPSRRTCRAGS